MGMGMGMANGNGMGNGNGNGKENNETSKDSFPKSMIIKGRLMNTNRH